MTAILLVPITVIRWTSHRPPQQKRPTIHMPGTFQWIKLQILSSSSNAFNQHQPTIAWLLPASFVFKHEFCETTRTMIFPIHCGHLTSSDTPTRWSKLECFANYTTHGIYNLPPGVRPGGADTITWYLQLLVIAPVLWCETNWYGQDRNLNLSALNHYQVL